MFSIEFLNKIRSHELSFYKPFLPAGSKVLEIGGGTGVQAKQLSEIGLEVTSVDIADSNYAEDRVFPIVNYDGKHLPFDSHSYDIVFSSNVLEHIRDLDELHNEIKRVLKKDGISIHAMPSATWRFWTNVAHYVDLLQRITKLSLGLFPSTVSLNELRRIKGKAKEIIGTIIYFSYPPTHGEYGNCITEIYTFSRNSWVKHFKSNNYQSIEVYPMRLFYTGHMILGEMLSLKTRELLSRFLGSACILYKVDE